MRASVSEGRGLGARLFLVGFSTLTLIYAAQPLLPDMAGHFGVSAGASAWAVSATTTGVAAANLLSPRLAANVDVRRFIAACLALAAVFTAAAAVASGWPLLLIARALAGLALGGVPAVALAHAGEEAGPQEAAAAVGLYVAGTALGGMSGRVLIGVLADAVGWRAALAGAGAISLLAAAIFLRLGGTPATRPARPSDAGSHIAAFAACLGDARLRRLLFAATALTCVSALLFNFIPFRLRTAPYDLSHAAASLVYLVFGLGMAASAVGGRIAGRRRRRVVTLTALALLMIGVAATLARPLAGVVLGLALVNVGFFAAHAVLSGWIGDLAPGRRAQASALYMLFYYLGFSLGGALGGLAWTHGGWPMLVIAAGACGLAAVVAVAGLAVTPPPADR